MKKGTKSLWIYTAILFSIAIVLILLTTLTQSKIVDNDGNLSVLGSFTATSKEKIINLQNENIALLDELNTLQEANARAQAAADGLAETVQTEQTLKENVAKLYAAYADDDDSTMRALLTTLTEDQINERIPGLYGRVQRSLEAKDE